MLEYLRIRNLALIEDMELEFSSGMNALTGETGAGKSFILKAINFVLGEKLEAEMVRPGKEKAQVEALFSGSDGDIVLRRELLAGTGRSRFFLNGDLSSQDVIRAMRPALVLHAGQHGQQRLLLPSYQAQLVDAFLDDPDLPHRKDAAVKELKGAAEELHMMRERIRELEERRELLEMQQKEIERVAPLDGEEEKLEAMKLKVRGVEQVRGHYERGLEIMRGAESAGLLDLLGQLERLLEQLSGELHNEKDTSDLQIARDAVSNFREEAAELDRRFRTVPSLGEDFDAVDPEDIESRLYALAQLKRKLRRSLPEILELKKEITANLSFLDASALDLHRQEKRVAEAAEKLHLTLELCNAARLRAAELFCRALEKELAGLGFSERVHVEPELTEHEIWPAVGKVPPCIEQRVRLMWAPNPGQPAQPLDRIASGGELSRFLLAVVSLQARGEDATLIFDEVDAGVGGLTLNRVADRLAALSARRQMLIITHWPQLAARAERHFRVMKEEDGDETFTRCEILDADARSIELARMSGREEGSQS